MVEPGSASEIGGRAPGVLREVIALMGSGNCQKAPELGRFPEFKMPPRAIQASMSFRWPESGTRR